MSMPMPSMNDLTRLGVAAACQGEKIRARQLLGEAIKTNEKDLIAWWWFAEVMDDPKLRHKCLETARAIAAESEADADVYKQLLSGSGAPQLVRYRVADQSKSLGDQCPICSLNTSIGDEIVICPLCSHANHRECWEENVFHCGNFACDGAALINDADSIHTEPESKVETIRLDEKEIPAESPYAKRGDQEAGFVHRLQQRTVEAILDRALQEAEAERLE